MDYLDIPPLCGASGTVSLPGSKSISNRVLLLAALAQGETRIGNLLMSDDVARMLEALEKLGIRVKQQGTDWIVQGAGGHIPAKDADLFLGNAGTAFRPLTAVLALSGGNYRLSGVSRMHERPIGDLVEALRTLGADIRYEEKEGYPPLVIRPATLRPAPVVRVRGDVSSQFLTALLMALPLSGNPTVIEVEGTLISRPYIDITLALMARFGVRVEQQGPSRFILPAAACYRSPGEFRVEGDASSASYFLAAGAVGGGPVRVEGMGRDSIQGDVRFADALAALGAEIDCGGDWIEARAPARGKLRAFDMDLNHIPDAAMTLAVLALFAEGPSTLRNIASWRVKETDRIAAMAAELEKLGAKVTTGEDFLTITPPPSLRSAVIDTYDDHRMAMCFSLAAFGGCRVRINDPGCVGKTFPDYFAAFKRLARPVPVVAIDGPSASGKGTVAERVARALGFHYLDSGSLYRLVALAAMRAKVALDDESGVAEIATTLPARFEAGQVWLENDDVTAEIRSEECSVGASRVATLPAVRAALLGRQRDYRRAPGLVGEGRDMGSVVFPDAALKIFLTASAEIRAQRRYKQLLEKGMSVSMADLLQDLRERDARDAARKEAPLLKLPEAVLLDTESLSIDEAVAFVIAHYEQRNACSG